MRGSSRYCYGIVTVTLLEVQQLLGRALTQIGLAHLGYIFRDSSRRKCITEFEKYCHDRELGAFGFFGHLRRGERLALYHITDEALVPCLLEWFCITFEDAQE